MEVVLSDDYGVFDEFQEYLLQPHPVTAWDALANHLRDKLEASHSTKIADNYHKRYESNQISSWLIHALSHANRDSEIIPLCEIEARRTASYDRLVGMLIDENRFKDAEDWILEGLNATRDKWRGTASILQNQLQEIREKELNWEAVAAIDVMKFIQQPTTQEFIKCKKCSEKIELWPKIRD